MPLATGHLLKDRYRIVKLLGQGGMGAVYRAWDTSLNIPVALKENLDATTESQKQFTREAQMLARLSHPNLPRVVDYFFLAGQGQYLVMDYVEGEDLETKVMQMGSLPEPVVLDWIIQVSDALSYLHSQSSPVIHRDIKPGNIKIRPDGRALLVDFGIAKIFDQHLRTTMGAKAVSPHYSPPEQYGSATTDARSDIYALGATLYHMLTGQLPPESILRTVGSVNMPEPHQFNPRITPRTEMAILKAMELSPEMRFHNAEEFRAALQTTQPPQPAIAQQPTQQVSSPQVYVAPTIMAQPIQPEVRHPIPVAPPITPPIVSAPSQTTRRRPWMIIAAILGALALVAGSGLAYLYFSDSTLGDEILTELGIITPTPTESPLEPTTELTEPAWYIPRIDAGVTSVQFYESDSSGVPLGDRTYNYSFPQTETRFINWELNLEHPSVVERTDFSVHAIFYYPDGSIFAEQDLSTFLDPGWPTSSHNHGWGWEEAGNWLNGIFRVDLFVDGELIARGSFEIYE